MNEKMTNSQTENNDYGISVTAAGTLIPIVPITPIEYSIDTYTVNINTSSASSGDTAYCDDDRRIHCNISITPGAKFKSISKVLLLLKHSSGAEEGFTVHKAYSDTILDANEFAYMNNRYNSSNAISYRVIDISDKIKGAATQTLSLAIKNTSGNSCSVSTSGCKLEIEYLEDDDFIPNVSKLEKAVGTKGAYSVNTRNGKLFYKQTLIQAKGGRMPLDLSMTYNAADCDSSSPNGISTGIKGWTFNYGQTLKTSSTSYTLLDGRHTYRTFKVSANDSAVRYDASGRDGLVLTEDSAGYYITDGRTMTYTFDTGKRLVNIASVGGTSAVTSTVTYNSDGKINTITDGMCDVYGFTYTDNTITISRDTTALVNIALEDQRVKTVLYVLSGESYSFGYDDDTGELLTVTEAVTEKVTEDEEISLGKKCVFVYSDAGEATAAKNYVHKNGVSSPTDCYFLNYTPLKTVVSKCRSSDDKAKKYSATVYIFAENGETVFTYEDGSAGAFTNMRFRTKNDYERYVADVICASNAADRSNAGRFLFTSQVSPQYSTDSLTGTLEASSDTLSFNTFSFPSKNFIFTAKALIDVSSYSTSDGSQSVKLLLKEDGAVITSLNFDAQMRDYQVKSAMIHLDRGEHELTAELQINNMYANVKLSDVLIFETNRANHTEYIKVFTDSLAEEESDGSASWYVNRGGYTLTSGETQITGVKYTSKDYMLTTISRLKNPSSFNVWYNDGENMLAGVSSAYLIKNGVTQSIENVQCCTVTKSVERMIFSTVEASSASGGLFKSVNITKMQKEIEDADGNTTLENEYFCSSINYNSYTKPIEVTNEDGIVTQYTYNEYGEVLTEKIFTSDNSTLNTLVTKEYTDGNLSAIKEKRLTAEYTHAFGYNSDDTLNYEITPGGQYIYRNYTADREKLSQISATVSEVINSNDMTYTGDLLKTASHNGTDISFTYDERNKIAGVNIAGVDILTKTATYNPYGTTQVVTEYANGAKIKTYYDKYNRLIKVTDVTDAEAETDICSYIYSNGTVESTVVSPTDSSLEISEESKLRAFVDSAAGTRTKYLYDDYGKVKEVWIGNARELINEKDGFERPTCVSFIDGEVPVRNRYTFENDYSDTVASETVEAPEGNTEISYTRDALKRISSIKTLQDGNGYERKFFYTVRGSILMLEGTTNYVGSVSYYNVVNDVSTLEKTESIAYNADGNIIKYGENTYEYDNLGRLVRENNKTLDKSILLCYNMNILSKTEYAYTTGTVGTATKVYNYTYGNGWKDQLTEFDGSTITYDESGNPLNYLGKTLTWSRGRLLTQYVSGSKTVDMQYNAKGIRVGKTRKIGSLETNSAYIYDNNGRLRTETEGSITRNYYYGQDGIVGYEEDGERFMYRKNFFGDITAIYQGTTKIAEYAYDAWGNCTVVSDTNGYGARNPFRYRGYYFDTDLNMYYLTTRYYDPQTGRFINADSIEYLKPDKINGLNLYAYCKNNPVMYFDPTGQFIEIIMASALVMFAIAIGIAIVGVVGGAIKAAVEAVSDWAHQLYDDIVDFLTSLTPEQVDRAVGASSNGSQNSSHVKNLYELYGGSGSELEQAVHNEYDISLGWQN